MARFCSGRLDPAALGAHAPVAVAGDPSARRRLPSGEARGDGHPGGSISGRRNSAPTPAARSAGHDERWLSAVIPSLITPMLTLLPIATYRFMSAAFASGSELRSAHPERRTRAKGPMLRTTFI